MILHNNAHAITIAVAVGTYVWLLRNRLECTILRPKTLIRRYAIYCYVALRGNHNRCVCVCQCTRYIVYAVHYTVYIVHCTMCTLYTLQGVHCKIQSIHTKDFVKNASENLCSH